VPFRNWKAKRRGLQIADLVSEDLKEREEELVSTTMIAHDPIIRWSELLTSKFPEQWAGKPNS
jgi:hypothetical protein